MAVSPATRQAVRDRAQRRCEYCHADERWQFIRFIMDQVLPQSAGGSDDAENLALACRNCNERRGNRVEGLDPETATVVALFNPRHDIWMEHFSWDVTRPYLVGQTPTGRATIVLLDLRRFPEKIIPLYYAVPRVSNLGKQRMPMWTAAAGRASVAEAEITTA